MQFEITLFAGGVIAYLTRPGNRSEDVARHVAHVVLVAKWLFVLVLVLAAIGAFNVGLAQTLETVAPGLAVWGLMEILIAVYLAGCRRS